MQKKAVVSGTKKVSKGQWQIKSFFKSITKPADHFLQGEDNQIITTTKSFLSFLNVKSKNQKWYMKDI